MNKRILFVLIGLALSIGSVGCAHKTPYEKCLSSDELSRYASLDQCMNAHTNDRSALGNVFSGMGAGLQQSANKNNINCHTTIDNYTNTAYTHCQ